MKEYRIEYKKVIVAYRSWWRPVYDFRFCVIETDEKIVCSPPTYLDTISPILIMKVCVVNIQLKLFFISLSMKKML